MKRLITAAVLIPLVAWVVLYSPSLVLLAVTAAVATLCFREFAVIAAAHHMQFPAPVGMAAGIALLAAPSLHVAVLVLTAALMTALLLRRQDLASVLPGAAAFLFGLVYIFGAWRCAVELRAINAHWLLYAMALNWVGDIAAFYTGSAFGRHKLAPRVSPAKTWEGAIGSVVVSAVFGVLYLGRFLPEVPVWEAGALTAVANIAGQFGDLGESAMKRGAGLKDSGHSLPGHGGWLDRVDSTLFALAVVYFWLTYGALR